MIDPMLSHQYHKLPQNTGMMTTSLKINTSPDGLPSPQRGDDDKYRNQNGYRSSTLRPSIPLPQPVRANQRSTSTQRLPNTFVEAVSTGLRQTFGKRNSDTTSSAFELGQKKSSNLLREDEIYQAEMMFRSKRTQVKACSCLANLYFAEDINSSVRTEWELSYTGIPMLVYYSGDMGYRIPTGSLSLVIAERGTGFALWQDELINGGDSGVSGSRYTEVERTFHTFYLASQPHRLAGLSFDNSYAATQFFRSMSTFSKHLPVGRNISRAKLIKRSKFEKVSARDGQRGIRNTLTKSNISTPCCFQHVTSLKASTMLPQPESDSDPMDVSPNSELPMYPLPTSMKSSTQAINTTGKNRAQSCLNIYN